MYSLCTCIHLLSSEKNFTNRHFCINSRHKSEYTLNDNCKYHSTIKPHLSYSSFLCFSLLNWTIQISVSCIRAIHFIVLAIILSYYPLDDQHGSSWQKRKLRTRENELLLYRMMAFAIKDQQHHETELHHQGLSQ